MLLLKICHMMTKSNDFLRNYGWIVVEQKVFKVLASYVGVQLKIILANLIVRLSLFLVC